MFEACSPKLKRSLFFGYWDSLHGTLSHLFFPSTPIQEFKFMGQCRSPSISPSRQAVSSSAPAQEELSLFQQFLQEGNPFEMHIEQKEEETEDVLASNGVGVEKWLSAKRKDRMHRSLVKRLQIKYFRDFDVDIWFKTVLSEYLWLLL